MIEAVIAFAIIVFIILIILVGVVKGQENFLLGAEGLKSKALSESCAFKIDTIFIDSINAKTEAGCMIDEEQKVYVNSLNRKIFAKTLTKKIEKIQNEKGVELRVDSKNHYR